VHLTISCDTCVARHTTACDDCVVSFFCGREETLELDDVEAEAVAGLAAAGLVPDLRYQTSATHPSARGVRGGRPAGGAELAAPAADGAELAAGDRPGVRRHPNLRLVPGGRAGRHH